MLEIAQYGLIYTDLDDFISILGFRVYFNLNLYGLERIEVLYSVAHGSGGGSILTKK